MKNGKVKKVAVLDKVVQICNAHGASYTPSKASLQPTALRSLLELAQEKQKAVTVTRSDYALAVNARQQNLAGLRRMATQVARMVSASNASKEDREEARLIIRRLRGGVKRQVILPATADTASAPKGTRRMPRFDRDSTMATFHELIELVQRIPGYKPIEPEFTVADLQARLSMVKNQCQAATAAAISYSNARIARDQLWFGKEGVVETINEAKDYIRAKFGSGSQQSQQTKTSMNF